MSIATLHNKIPDFQAQAYPQMTINNDYLLGKWTILYFYPKDNTPGCTQESLAFQASLGDITALNAQVIGVSRDSLNSHEKFATKYELSFPLISDEDEQLCTLFAVLKEKMNYGRKYIGIERSTFLIDPQGILQHEWRKVSVKEHVQTVVNQLQSMI